MATSPPTVRRRVAILLDAGLSLEEIEEVVLDKVRLSEEERSALWLYAWGRPRSLERPSPGRDRRDHVTVPEVPPG